MQNLFKKINRKINGIIWSLFSTGIILILLSILVVWTDFVLRLIFAMFTLLAAYIFIYTGYKLLALKRDIEKHFHLK